MTEGAVVGVLSKKKITSEEEVLINKKLFRGFS